MSLTINYTCPEGHAGFRKEKDFKRIDTITCKKCHKRYNKSELIVEDVPQDEALEEQESPEQEVLTEVEPETLRQESEPQEQKTDFKDPSLSVEVAQVEGSAPTISKSQKAEKDFLSSSSTKFTKKQIEQFIDLLFNMLAAKRGDYWKLTPAEKEGLIEPMTRLANKYLGGKLGKYNDEIMVGVALGMIVITRVMLDRQNAKVQVSSTTATPAVQTMQVPEPELKPMPTTDDLVKEYPGLMP